MGKFDAIALLITEKIIHSIGACALYGLVVKPDQAALHLYHGMKRPCKRCRPDIPDWNPPLGWPI